MKKCIFNLLLIILLTISESLNPWPFKNFIQDSKADYIEKVITVRGGFDPLQGDAKNTNAIGPKDDSIKAAPKSVAQSSSSTSNSDPKVKYRRPAPGSNPGSSGSFDEDVFKYVNPDLAVSDREFWDRVGSLGESSDSEEEESTPTQAPRTTRPTGELTKQAIKENDQTTKIITPTKFNDWDGEARVIKSRELKKTVYAKGYKAGIVGDSDLISCPIQDDPNKYQRQNCATISDKSMEDMKNKLIDLTTSRQKDRVKLTLDMPFKKSEKAIAYMDLETGDCAFYHVDNGKFWTYVKYNNREILSTLADADAVKYAKPTDSNPEL